MGKLRIWAGGVAVGCVVAVVVGGCSPGDEPIVTESPSFSPGPSVSVTPSPSPSASALSAEELLALMPANAGAPDVQGAVVTAQFFLEQYAPMFHSGDTSVWDALSGPGCVYCADASTNADQVSELGWVATGGEIGPDTATSRGVLDGDARAVVQFDASFADAYLTKDAGTPELQEPESRHRVFVELSLVDGLWLVTGVMVDD